MTALTTEEAFAEARLFQASFRLPSTLTVRTTTALLFKKGRQRSSRSDGQMLAAAFRSALFESSLSPASLC